MKIQDWFDPNNIEHLKAYRHLEEEGFWQAGFIPNYITFDVGWQISILSKLANAWLNSKLP